MTAGKGSLMAWHTAATALTLAAVIAGCGHGPDLAGCKAEMQREYQINLARGYDTFTQRPPVCDGVTDAQLEQMAAQIMTGG